MPCAQPATTPRTPPVWRQPRGVVPAPAVVVRRSPLSPRWSRSRVCSAVPHCWATGTTAPAVPRSPTRLPRRPRRRQWTASSRGATSASRCRPTGATASWTTGVAVEATLAHPVVQRPGGASIDILCDPQNGYGVQFFDGSAADLAYRAGQVWQYEKGDAEAAYPEGAWLGYQRGGDTGDNIVWVVAPDRATVEEVLASFVRNASVDANGCAAHATDAGPDLAEGLVRLCRYGIDDWLEQSELLTGQDAADALAALESAPAKGDRMCTMALTGPVVQVTSADAQGRVTLDACHGFAWDGAEHDLTADVLYWVLTPGWSGGVEGDVPMPDKFRQ